MTPPRAAVRHRSDRGDRSAAGTALSPFLLADGRGAPRWPTAVEVAWDDIGLQVSFACTDDDAWGTFTARDAPLWQQEVVELFLAAGEETPTRYFEFEVSPAGVLFDARVENPHGDRLGMIVDPAWDCAGLEWRTEPTGERADWRAELAIPWRGLDLDRAPATLRANFYRIERPRRALPPHDAAPEFSCWSPTFTSPADFHRPARFGVLDLIR
jgi:hypothetical protein